MAGQRDSLVITSKVCIGMGPDGNDRGLSRRHIMLQVEASLRRLGTDRLDVYFCHHVDPKTDVEQTLRAFDDLVRHGKVLYPRREQLVSLADSHGYRHVRAAGPGPDRGAPADV